ncbi:uncharacterized protein [Watersipora subatra]|uniref:uncharacterized protein n=1 Tax=Watersipora subatra TaxID=2589382 RepID=UPI00355C7085
MDTTFISVFIFLQSLFSLSTGKNAYLCTWPTSDVIQLQCDNVNCPYLSVEQITVGRLRGNPSSCREFNANETTRKPISSCTYQLMETHDFFRQVRNNCSRKQICEISSNEFFQSAGTCGMEVSEQINIRNWVHIEYSCYGDILPGVKCEAPQDRPTSSEATNAKKSIQDTSTIAITRLRRPQTYRPSLESTQASKPKTSGMALVIPILATLLFCTLLLIVATMLYRNGLCRQRKSWSDTVESRMKQSLPSPPNKAQLEIDVAEFNIDTSNLRELEKRLQRNKTSRISSNDYCHAFALPTNTSTAQTTSKQLLTDVKMRPTSRKGRRASLELPVEQTTPTHSNCEMYYSDTSESTTTTAEQGFGSNDRRKRRRVKPLPPLPRPVIPHSEVYFTETETESEAPHKSSRRKEPLPILEPPPRLNRDKPKHDRLKSHKLTMSVEAGVPLQHPIRQHSLELALTKGAAKKLSIPVTQETKVKLSYKKPVARPRSSRTSTSLYGNILRDENMRLPASIGASGPNTGNTNNLARCHTVPSSHNYKNNIDP